MLLGEIGLGQGKYQKGLKYLTVPESKEMLKTKQKQKQKQTNKRKLGLHQKDPGTAEATTIDQTLHNLSIKQAIIAKMSLSGWVGG